MANYSRELLEDPRRQRYIREFFGRVERDHPRNERLALSVKRLAPGPYRFLRRMIEPRQKSTHFGQVLPIEDVETVIDLVGSVTRLTCVCRKVTTGKERRYCFALGADIGHLLDPYPSYKAGLEVLSPGEAKDAARRLDHEGEVHTVWTMLTPFIGAVCNCDGDCLAVRAQHSLDLATVMFKAEYVAAVDRDLCLDCGECRRVCPFGAIGRDTRGPVVNKSVCYGCGLCRAACEARAITLAGRTSGLG
jgi:Pyruvate/2-oxoacid:ferredoxin oxidoreductase delta subunit